MLLNSVLNPSALPSPTGEWEPIFGQPSKGSWVEGQHWLTAAFSLKKGKDKSA